MITPEQAVVYSIVICIGGAVATLLVSQSKSVAGWISFFATLATAVLIFTACAGVLTGGPSPHPATFWTMPNTGYELRFYVDGLSAIFLGLVAIMAVPAALYSISYVKRYSDYGAGRYYPHLLLFLGGMYGLLSTTDMMWYFFIFWQLMTLPSFALVRYENKNRANVNAAYKYLIFMEVACVAVMIGAGLLAGGGGAEGAGLKYDFDVVSAGLPAVLASAPGTITVAFLLFLVGFGIKMGMWPFGQLWVPEAYTAAPSPISSLLSSVLSKSGVYGLMRSFLWLVPAGVQAQFPLGRWGMIVAILGTVTLFTGTMQALKQEQTKRLLAFHSIGQIGYILLGTGVCMSLVQNGDPRLASLAVIGICGALFHSVNHGLFKGLLFLNAGSIEMATGTQELNKLGGLMKYMPLTAVTALIASFSISGVPLFNGFASKWSIYVGAVQGSNGAGYLAVCALIAIMTSALTLASFIKFFGVSFLSRPSTLVEASAGKGKLEVGSLMQLPQVFLAAVCILLGTIPACAYWVMQHALNASRQGFGTTLADAQPMLSGSLVGLDAVNGTALFAPLAIMAVLFLVFLVTYVISKLGGATRRAAVPWLCGYVLEADCYRYSAHNFYGEIKRYFRWLGGMPSHSHTETKKD
jgi:formate hydrogenlyase subunit 3/multisubunit Na+/H+ antiporter MnhD subunit